jgi:hypothetical protein
MSFTITCYTLFDITPTGVMNRHRPVVDEEIPNWLLRRNTQCNFDTVVQSISLRSQPDVRRKPEKIQIRFDQFTNFGFLYQQLENETYDCWSFDFDIQHPSVFNDGINELGALYSDCDTVPMIKTNTAWNKLPAFLDTSDELRNIYFKVVNYG